jgi:hypothetical protein
MEEARAHVNRRARKSDNTVEPPTGITPTP